MSSPGAGRGLLLCAASVRPTNRLQIIVAHERSSRGGPDYLPQLKQDILDVIRKYVNIDPEKITVQLDQKSDELSVLELNITFADDKKG